MRRRVTTLALAHAALVVTACGSDSSGGPENATIGWVPKEDEETGIAFALPPPVTGPEEQRRPGRSTAVASRSYAARAGELTLSLQVLTTPESPGSLAAEVPARRMPFLVIDRIRSEGDYAVDVLSNERVEGAEQETYDALLRASSGEEEAVWAMRTRPFDNFVLVTQVVGFPEDGVDAAFEQQVETALDRLNDTVQVPASG